MNSGFARTGAVTHDLVACLQPRKNLCLAALAFADGDLPRANWLFPASRNTYAMFSVSRSTLESGIASAFWITPARTSAVTYMSFFSRSPGLDATMRACSVRVVGSSADAK